MRSKKKILSNFTRSSHRMAHCLRPESLAELQDYLRQNKAAVLARGAGLSYSDSCFNTQNYVIETNRFNHLIAFDAITGEVECQPAVSFKDLLLLHPDFIPPVLPGSMHVSIGGGIAHDVHGKNNHQEGSFGKHLVWFDLLTKGEVFRCSRTMNTDLFYASIAGLGLTGVITRVRLRLKKASSAVQIKTAAYSSVKDLMNAMSGDGLGFDYQMAWLDLSVSEPRGLHRVATHCHDEVSARVYQAHLPKLPFCLLSSWNIKLFNAFVFNTAAKTETLDFKRFNNPLDSIQHWNRIYGRKGLIQFQALFEENTAFQTFERLIELMRSHRATASLAVLKYFKQKGPGLLSFCKPGFTLAIDFINNVEARRAISAMNQYIARVGGRIYLAKDLLLQREEFESMYDEIGEFKECLRRYNSPMQSDLARRLGLSHES